MNINGVFFMVKEKRLTLLIIVIAIIAVVSVSGCIGDSSDDSSSEATVSEDTSSEAAVSEDTDDSESDDESYQSSSSSDRSNPYWASTIRDKFHRSSCEWAQEIDDVNLVTYPNRDAAIADGKVPCKVCEP